ncbi:uncharacterized protein M421DRAFT_396812 [Didymella exigua CBS 183.55]|uniref:DUF1989 domain-containing protein n=1 Tax=Didymella exigua CBS 183.55 TaxID=1150837 RepID=A0A6A5RG47_9PLEO|nr:uncharacterized protein M421DRAFT_396812 [Didymella exigua CBS 183.55]KAF1926443.1 hypothetical protein M421DRAFT_396812 [Didymella exigua CBS 183.55]
MSSTQTVPARRCAATVVRANQRIKIINTYGNQVVDTWVFALPWTAIGTTSSRLEAPLYPAASAASSSSYSTAANRAAARPEFMSMSHCCAKLLKPIPGVGDTLVNQKRAPLVKLIEDTSPGTHDTLIAAAGDSEEGEILAGLQTRMGGRVPDLFKLFRNIPVTQEGEGARRRISFEAPVTKAMYHVVFEALRDVVVVMSACPQDMLEINGKKPVNAHFKVY